MYDKIVRLICEQLPVQPEDVKPESNLVEDLGADSANLMMLIMDLEQEFNVTVEDEVLVSIATVQDIWDYLKEHA
ncbi:MAG: acyl carrier protein [Christensenellales bacterium]|jgi:acyl carrier protein